MQPGYCFHLSQTASSRLDVPNINNHVAARSLGVGLVVEPACLLCVGWLAGTLMSLFTGCWLLPSALRRCLMT
jgi:hypothetical protein